MKFIFHGGAKEVGKSCIELVVKGNTTFDNNQEKRFLLDAGLKFKENGFEAPFQVFDIPKIDGLFLSHAHLDHTGALPLFEHYNLLCPIFTTQQTKELTKILLKDSYKIARIKHLHPAYNKLDLKKVYANTKIVDFNKWYKHSNIEFKFLNAGHIPGSAMILIRVEGKNILYTGDYKYASTELMKGIDSEQFSEKDIDILITESTYGGKPLPDRGVLEDAFLDKITEVIKNGSVVIPVFSLGRAQEILILLSKKKWPVPIYLDGMAVDVTKAILSGNPSYLNERKKLQEMYRKADIIKKDKKRRKVINNKGIFITTSGMLQGGPIVEYLENMWGNPNNAFLLTGFQCKRTNGRLLLEEGYVYINGWKTYVKAQYQKFDFSGHSDDNELKKFIKLVNPKNLIINHGDEDAVSALKVWAERNLTIKVYAPAVGDSIIF